MGTGEQLKLGLRKGHGVGQTSCAWVGFQGRLHLGTCGADGKTVLRDSTTLETEFSCRTDHGAAHYVCVSPSGTCLAVGDDQYVKLYKSKGLEFEKNAARFTLPVRGLAFSPNGKLLAAGGDAEGIKVYAVDKGQVERTLACEGYVTALMWDPEARYLAVVQRDGYLTVYDLQAAADARPELRKRLAPKSDPAGLARHQPAWHPDGGTLLAVPGNDNDVVLYERLSWEIQGYLSGEHTEAVNLVAFCPNGLYAATAGLDGKVVVWDVVKALPLATAVAGSGSGDAAASSGGKPVVISGLAWHPSANELALVGEDGSVGLWDKPVPVELPGPSVSVEELEKAAARQAAEEGAGDEETATAAGEADEEGSGADNGYGYADQEMEDVMPAEEGGAEAEAADKAIAAKAKAKPGAALGAGVRMAKGQTVQTIVKTIIAKPPGPAPQVAIQPGSTPAQPNGQPHFLAYNELGCVTSRRVGNDHSVVEVSLHDTAYHSLRVPLLTDYYGFTLASLSLRGVLYASPPAADGVPAMLVYRQFSTWSANGEWQASLPDGEQAVCIASGASFAAAATNKQLIRIFTPSGVQHYVFRLDGPPVAMAAHDHKMAIMTHAGPPNPLTKSQTLNLVVFDMTTYGVSAQGPCLLSPGSSLTWLGFSEDGFPVAMDSTGVMSIRTADFGGRWTPIFDSATERKSTEVFWPVSVTNTHFNAVMCTPQQPYPSVKPAPFFTSLPLQVSVVGVDHGQPALEGEVLLRHIGLLGARARIDSAHTSGAQGIADLPGLEEVAGTRMLESDKVLLRLVQASLKADRPMRAYEFCLLINDDRSLEGALKLANYHRCSQLVTRVEQLIASRRWESAGGVPGQQPSAGAMPDDLSAAITPVPVLRRPHSPISAGLAARQLHMQQQQAMEAQAAAAAAAAAAAVAEKAAVQPAAAGGKKETRAGAGSGGAGGSGRGPLGPGAGRANTAANAGTNGEAGASKPGQSGAVLTPGSLLAAATNKPDAADAGKRKPTDSNANNPFARKSKAHKH